MASGKITGTPKGSSSGLYNLWIEWSSKNPPGVNYSNVTAKMYVQRNDGYAGSMYSYSSNPKSITVNGTKKSAPGAIDTRNNVKELLIASDTIKVNHNADGTKKITISGSFSSDVPNLSGGTVSGTATLDKIPRVPPTAASITFSANPIPHTSTCKVGASGGNWGDAGKGTYTFQYRKKGATSWTQLYQGGTSSVSFTPSGKGGTYGTVFEFRVILTNAINQTATSGVKSLTCAPQPAAPKSLAAAPRPIKRNETVRLTWAAGASGDKSYQVRVRYYNGSSWSDYQSIGNTTSTSFSHTPSSLYTLSPKGKLEYSVRAQDKYSRDTGYTAIEVGIRGGLMPVKVNGAWNTDAQAKVKTDGTWTDADSIYVKAGGAWKSQI